MKKSQTETIQQSRRIEGLKTLAIVFSIVIYLSFVAYAEFHLYNLITNFVPADFQAIGVVAVGVSALTAVALPLAIHFWFRSGGQQTFAFVFYGMHFVFVVFNLILDSHMVEGSEAPPFVTDVYSVWILPGYLALYGVCWTVIWFMDDSSKEIDRTRELGAREREFALNRKMLVVETQQSALEAAFESAEAKQVVNRWAAHNAPKLLAAELGMTPQELGIDEQTVFKYWLNQQEKQAAQEVGHNGNYQNGVTVNRMAADGVAGPIYVREADGTLTEVVSAPARPTNGRS